MILLHLSMVQTICSSALVEIKHIKLDYVSTCCSPPAVIFSFDQNW